MLIAAYRWVWARNRLLTMKKSESYGACPIGFEANGPPFE